MTILNLTQALKPVCLVSLLLLYSAQLFCQNEVFEQAYHLSVSGKHQEANKIYDELIEENGLSQEIMLAKAFNYSWAGKYTEAGNWFDKVLDQDKENLEALSGTGYNLAWAGLYGQAAAVFEKIDRIYPGNVESTKGLGYIHLWQGKGDISASFLKKLLSKDPTNEEYLIALAQSYEVENKNKLARETFQSVVENNPESQTALKFLNQLNYKASFLEFDLWGGWTRFSETNKFGLRSAQISLQASKKIRTIVKYDNSLSLENYAFALGDRQSSSISAGILAGYHKKHSTYVETGYRWLPNQSDQYFVRGEQIYFISSRFLVKAGGLVGIQTDNSNEWMVFSSLELPITQGVTLIPAFYHTRNQGSIFPENRFGASGRYRLSNGYEFSGGLTYGRVKIEKDAVGENVYNAHFTGLFPFSRSIWGQVAIQQEWGILDDFLALNLGLKFRLDR